MSKNKGFFTGLLGNVCFGIQTSYRASKFYFCMKLICLLSSTFIPLINFALWREVINGITDGTGTVRRTVVCLAAYLALTLTVSLLTQFNLYVNNRYSDELQFYIETVMMEKSSRMDLAFFDSAKMGDRMRHVQSNFRVVSQMTWVVFDILAACVNVVTTLVLICAYRWWLGLCGFVLLIPYMIASKRHADRKLTREKEQLRDKRQMDWHRDVFFNNTVQFEIKLHGIGGYFIERYRALWQGIWRVNRREEARHQGERITTLLLGDMGILLVIFVAVFDVIGGRLGVGDLQYYLNVASRLSKNVMKLMDQVNLFLNNNTRLLELQEFMDIEPEVEKSGTRQPSSNPRIEFCNVSFRYPGAEQYVLRDCSFVIEPHERVGLIGLNGAGKSTVIKLMLRFYDPESGAILLDGVDLREYDTYAVRRVFGVLFQDYVTYCLPLREIIALSDFGARFDDEKLRRACEISGAAEIIRDWEQGFDSVLGRHYADNGKDLSGGQWQLIGLARAYFKESEYMILDEPSAALDPISEDRIFDRLYRLGQGKTSLTVSHRLSNTTPADRILVLGDGRILEQGSHADLLRQNGEYARLFALQASKYR